MTVRAPPPNKAQLCCHQELTGIAFANTLDYLNIENG